MRIAGQVIWAARFKEHAQTSHQGGGKGGGPRVTSTNYSYSLSFAIGLCEGEIVRVDRAWANGNAFDLSQVSWRLHTGAEDQITDALIESIEGADAPAYRGLAYIVFEDLPLEAFGNTIPQLSFEVFRTPPSATPGPRFEERVKGVCLIPGCGEFVYATEPVRRAIGPGQELVENVHIERERTNLLVSLHQLKSDLPNCENVLLVVSWFGDDLRCGECEIRPGVEIADKDTAPLTWRVGGVSRDAAHLVTQIDGAPAFGGTPSDATILQAMTELKARGYRVGLYPFLLMDVPSGNALPDPYGGAAQAAYPWRGRVTLDIAPGQPGSHDKHAEAAAQIASFFGSAAAGDFSIAGDDVSYAGPAEWSFRRFILHYAKLASIAGGVDFFILGSELRGLTTLRDGAASFPAVAALKTLAHDVRTVLTDPGMTLTYAADWSEYFGHQPQDGSGDVFFHLDPLWADTNISAVGVDFYPPLTDWRDGLTHADADLARDIHDPSYLESRIEAGEDFDFFYASDADRAAQTRTPISDGAYSEPWIFRAKDVRNFWSRTHHNRPSGVRDSAATPWTAQSKPILFVELGCPAIDKGANAPNLFIDPKSSESALPPFSGGTRDDLIQRRTLDAYLRYWDAHNATSSIDGKPMIDHAFIWAWDARPFPAFPARRDVWADGDSWRLGHWLNGRAGMSGLGEVVADLCGRSGVDDADVSGLTGAVSGYVVDAPSTARAGLEPLMQAFAFDAAEREGRMVFFHADDRAPLVLSHDDFTDDSSDDVYAQRGDAADNAIEARVRFLDAGRDYALGGVSARRLDRAEGGVVTIEAPLVLETDAAEAIAQRLLAERRAAAESLRIGLGPAALAIEPGDHVALDGDEAFEITRIEDAETRRLELQRVIAAPNFNVGQTEPSAPVVTPSAPTPAISILDLPPLLGVEDDDRPLAAVFASPWLNDSEVYAGPSDALLTKRASVSQAAIMGELLWALFAGPVGRWDEGNVVQIKLYGGVLASVTEDALLNGENAFAIESSAGAWEIVQARNAVLVAPNTYELSGLLRGQQGSEQNMGAPTPVGARIVKLDTRLARLSIAAHEWNEALQIAVPPTGATAQDVRAAHETDTLAHVALQTWAPAHLKAARAASRDVAISWIRRARSGGDAWGPGDPPLGPEGESYRLDIWNGASIVRTVTVSTSAYTYNAASQLADFGFSPSSLHLRVAQLGSNGVPGLNTELTIPL